MKPVIDNVVVLMISGLATIILTIFIYFLNKGIKSFDKSAEDLSREIKSLTAASKEQTIAIQENKIDTVKITERTDNHDKRLEKVESKVERVDVIETKLNSHIEAHGGR